MSNASLLVFADDWGRHPSSCQHLIRQLLDRHAVCWVNTIGTRKPQLNLATLRRGLEKVKHWLRRPPASAALPCNLRVANPRMWPWISRRGDRWLNRQLLLRQLTPLVRSLPQPVVGVTTLPIVADLMGPLPVQRWVYYCVDDFGQWPGLDQRPLRQMEECVVRRADAVIAASTALQERLAQLGRAAHLLTHGVELGFWQGNGHPCIAQLDGLERPLVVFWGVIDRRMDLGFVQRLAAELKQGTIVLTGPEADPDPKLFRLPRVFRLPPLQFEQLPQLGREAAVLIMPYADLPVTRQMQPLKLKEYLATGKPVVVRDLPANRAWADCLDLAATPEEFTGAVRRRLETGLPAEQRQARARLSGESWAEKARAFEQWALHG